ncbi:MAG: universal stress protein [Hamadaea sp.]|nr:universal stress protein [Hamadaea sp.]
METRTSTAPIVVGFDDSVHAHLALRWAMAEAALRNASLEIAYSLEWLPELTDAISSTTEIRVQQRVQAMVEHARESAQRQLPQLEVCATVHTGHPTTVLCELSEHASMVVLGSRGRGGFTGLLTGSVSVGVATHAHCPVVVIRSLPAGYTKLPVVAGVDESPSAEQAIRFAFAEAARRRVPLVALRAWHPYVPSRYADGFLRAEEIAEIESAESNFVHGYVERTAKSFPDVEVRYEIVADVAATALTTAAESAQLVVVGSRGRGGFTGLLLGSVGLHLLHNAACPVAIVREPATGT